MNGGGNAVGKARRPSARNDKKKYSSPRLIVYGDIRTVTKSTRPVGMGDGAMSGIAKTA